MESGRGLAVEATKLAVMVSNCVSIGQMRCLAAAEEATAWGGAVGGSGTRLLCLRTQSFFASARECMWVYGCVCVRV